MSKKNKTGAWVIPVEQLKEFSTGPINYRELVKECLQPAVTKMTIKKVKRKWK